MIYPVIKDWNIVGYDAYYDSVMPELEVLLDQYMQDTEYNYLIAVSEAVCNAARYAVAGLDNVHIHIRAYITNGDITTTVEAQTIYWDVAAFRDNMCKLADDEKSAEMEWGDYTGHSTKSRGFWLMLMACDYLYIDVSGRRISLCARRPFDSRHIAKKIKDLIPRLYLEKDGVIF